MRFIQAVAFLAFLLAIGIFAAQNTDVITVNFLTWKLAQPVALVTVAVYLLGMLSGWAVVAFIRRSLRGVTQRPGD
jgi:lipopolysaccharide assembly protein A